RHSAIDSPAGNSNSRPSTSISRTGPVTLYGPSSRTLISTSIAALLGRRVGRRVGGLRHVVVALRRFVVRAFGTDGDRLRCRLARDHGHDDLAVVALRGWIDHHR